MTSLKLKRRAARATLDLSDLMRFIGIATLSEEWVAKAKQAAEIGFAPGTSDLVLTLWRWLRKPEKWETIPYDEYLKRHEQVVSGKKMPTYGLPIPEEIIRRVATIKLWVPHAAFEVHALRSDDPYVYVKYGTSTICIGGWYGQGKRRRVFPEK